MGEDLRDRPAHRVTDRDRGRGVEVLQELGGVGGAIR
jgi:hypothetical protein